MGRSDGMSAALFIVAILALSGCAPVDDAADDADARLPDDCRSLFDGETLSGWTWIGEADIGVENGMIVGRAVHDVPNSFLATDKVFGDFDLRLEFNVDQAFNSGVQFRSAVATDTLRFPHQAGNGDRFTQVTRPGRVWGYQADIDPTDRGWTAHIYEEAGRGWLQTFDGEPGLHAIQPGTWHAMRIRAKGDTMRTWLDGALVTTLVDTLRSEGFIALQVHAVYAPEDTGKSVRFRAIEVCGS